MNAAPPAVWLALRLPSLPLDVFARGDGYDAATPFAVTTGGHYPAIVAAIRDALRQAGKTRRIDRVPVRPTDIIGG